MAKRLINPDNPLGRSSGEGRNPAIKNTPRSGQNEPLAASFEERPNEPLAASFEERPNHDVVPITWGIFNHLDTGLRRYDTVFSNGLFGVNALRKLWQVVRQLSGDDGYERYLAHRAAAHPGMPALPRHAWFAHHQQQKWSGIKRCC